MEYFYIGIQYFYLSKVSTSSTTDINSQTGETDYMYSMSLRPSAVWEVLLVFCFCFGTLANCISEKHQNC